MRDFPTLDNKHPVELKFQAYRTPRQKEIVAYFYCHVFSSDSSPSPSLPKTMQEDLLVVLFQHNEFWVKCYQAPDGLAGDYEIVDLISLKIGCTDFFKYIQGKSILCAGQIIPWAKYESLVSAILPCLEGGHVFHRYRHGDTLTKGEEKECIEAIGTIAKPQIMRNYADYKQNRNPTTTHWAIFRIKSSFGVLGVQFAYAKCDEEKMDEMKKLEESSGELKDDQLAEWKCCNFVGEPLFKLGAPLRISGDYGIELEEFKKKKLTGMLCKVVQNKTTTSTFLLHSGVVEQLKLLLGTKSISLQDYGTQGAIFQYLLQGELPTNSDLNCYIIRSKADVLCNIYYKDMKYVMVILIPLAELGTLDLSLNPNDPSLQNAILKYFLKLDLISYTNQYPLSLLDIFIRYYLPHTARRMDILRYDDQLFEETGIRSFTHKVGLGDLIPNRPLVSTDFGLKNKTVAQVFLKQWVLPCTSRGKLKGENAIILQRILSQLPLNAKKLYLFLAYKNSFF